MHFALQTTVVISFNRSSLSVKLSMYFISVLTLSLKKVDKKRFPNLRTCIFYCFAIQRRMNFYYMQTFFSLGLGDIGELKINVLLHQNPYTLDRSVWKCQNARINIKSSFKTESTCVQMLAVIDLPHKQTLKTNRERMEEKCDLSMAL